MNIQQHGYNTVKNPMAKQNLCVSEHVVALIDLLGFSNRAKQYGSNELLNHVHELYDSTKAIIDQLYSDSSVKIRIFSDNILIAHEIASNQIESIKIVTGVAAMFQMQALSAAWLSRGYIVIGELYIDDIHVFGDALIKAYLGESELSNYPRILISPDLKTLLAKTNGLDYHETDLDGETYIDFYRALDYTVDSKNPAYLELIIERISFLKNEPNISARAQQKIAWLINYHNYYCKRKNLPEEYLVAF